MPRAKPTTFSFPLKVRLRQRDSGAKVSSEIRPMAPADLEQWSRWQYGSADEDRSWEWDRILSDDDGGLIECYVLYARGQLQGLMGVDTRGRGVPKFGRALIIDYLASNPRNRRGAVGLKDVGTVFLAFAVLRSRELGYAGRLWLESLPGAAAVYSRLGFAISSRKSRAGYSVFRLDARGADQLVEAARGKDLI